MKNTFVLTCFAACMRMRQLGDGHTVMYFAPTEVHQKISDIARKSHDGSSIKAMDVLRWTIEETCEGIRHNVPLWASQGLSYHQRQKAWVEHWKQPSDGPELLDSLKETESQPLSSLYGFEGKRHDASANSLISTDKEIWDKCKYFGVDSLHNVRLQEEQEREVAQETEQERAVERPPPAQPAIHSIHPFIERFVIEGREPRGLAVMRAFDVFFKTSASKHIVNGWSDRVLVTQDFAKTNLKNEGGIDEYLRTVNWILSPTNKASPWVIISPYEANKLLPSIRQSRHVRLHVYSPRVTKDMKSFEDMTFMSIPPLRPSDLSAPSLEINIFAGQIFIKSFKEYKRVCGFLGLHLGALEEGDKGHVDSDGGFVSKERRMERGMDQSPFWESPVALVRDVLRLRRKGQDCSESHMERLLQGIPLRREDFV